MKLLTKELIRQFPKIGETDGTQMGERKIVAKFFTPRSCWTWYAFEYDGENEFFGLVDGFEKELGSFYLSELESLGMAIERDMYFGTPKIKDVAVLNDWLAQWKS